MLGSTNVLCLLGTPYHPGKHDVRYVLFNKGPTVQSPGGGGGSCSGQVIHFNTAQWRAKNSKY